MPAILSFLRSWHRDVGSSNEESTDARHSRKGGHHGEISYTSQLLDWRRSRFGHCSFRTRRLLFHREQFGHTYGETGSDQIITPTYPAYARTLDVTEKDIVRTEDADVVVVGSGSAGTFAAIRAAERGAHVIWLEKTTAKGGTSTITEGLTAFDGEQQRATGEASDLNGIYTALMDWHNWGAKTEAFQTYFDFSGKAVDWAVSHGASLGLQRKPQKAPLQPC